jgi:hypothetical protein
MYCHVVNICLTIWQYIPEDSELHRRWGFENRGVRRIFRLKWDEVTGKLIKLHSEELHILHSFPNTIRQMKSRRKRWAGHVACMREERKLYKVLVGKPEERDLLEDQGIHGRMGSDWILGDRLKGC